MLTTLLVVDPCKNRQDSLGVPLPYAVVGRTLPSATLNMLKLRRLGFYAHRY